MTDSRSKNHGRDISCMRRAGTNQWLPAFDLSHPLPCSLPLQNQRANKNTKKDHTVLSEPRAHLPRSHARAWELHLADGSQGGGAAPVPPRPDARSPRAAATRSARWPERERAVLDRRRRKARGGVAGEGAREEQAIRRRAERHQGARGGG
jgi:hypothetical protein